MSDLMTKRSLANALMELMRSKPLNKITIQNIADACGINRMTFYYGRSDRPDSGPCGEPC